MNKFIIKQFCFFCMILLLILMNACKEENINGDYPAPAQVLSPSYEPTHGGAIITYQLPEDENLLFVKAVYLNSQNEEVFKVSSMYNNQIEIDGFIDRNSHKVRLYSVGRGGKESAPVEMDVIPDISYIYLVQENMEIEAILGGVRISWVNPSEKTVFVYVDYEENGKAEQRILSSSRLNTTVNIRGLESTTYNLLVTVEDLSGNKTAVEDKGNYTPMPEQKIDKSTWSLVSNLSCNGDKYEALMTNFWDDVIDTKDDPSDNSYFLIHREDNGGSLRFLSESEENPLMIVIDLNKQVVLNRLVVWQRAYFYTSNDDGGVSDDYAYYTEDNMRSFHVYATNNLNDITAPEVWSNPLMICDIGDPREDDGTVPPDKIQEAIDGHEFELPNLSEPFRYLVIAITGTFGSETQICSSEISLYGLDNQ